MFTLPELALEVLGLLPDMVRAGNDIWGIVQRTIDLHNQPTPATQDELAALKVAIDAERQKLAGMTAQLDEDPA